MSSTTVADTPLAPLVRSLLAGLGENPDRQGLVKTPDRVEASLRWLTRGYSLTVEDAVGDALFEEEHESMILVRDIEFYSLCEHHLLPFFGVAHVAYIPDKRILGLSKLPRIVDIFARRLQVQERLTTQIADAIMEHLQPRAVGVVVSCRHLCMESRGIRAAGEETLTSALLGDLRTNLGLRTEFLTLVRRG